MVKLAHTIESNLGPWTTSQPGLVNCLEVWKNGTSQRCRHCLRRHVLKDETEHAMVRHEAAEALGSIASPDCLQLLTDYCKDSEPIVADSCVVSFLCLFLPVLLRLSYIRHLSCIS